MALTIQTINLNVYVQTTDGAVFTMQPPATTNITNIVAALQAWLEYIASSNSAL